MTAREILTLKATASAAKISGLMSIPTSVDTLLGLLEHIAEQAKKLEQATCIGEDCCTAVDRIQAEANYLAKQCARLDSYFNRDVDYWKRLSREALEHE